MAVDASYIPSIYDTGVVAGDYFARTFTLTNSDGSPYDLSGAVVKVMLGGVEYTCSVTNNVITWVIEEDVTAEMLTGIEMQKYDFNIKVFQNSQPRTIIRGVFSVI